MNTKASVVDLFCGVGSLTHGFKAEGFPIACGIDVDETCRYPFETNNGAPFIRWDVADISSREVEREFHPGAPKVLAGCAPCQPFSVYNQKNDDPNWQLVGEFSRLIREIRPDVVTMENVPRLMKFRGGQIFRDFVDDLQKADYHVWRNEIFCPDYGVPQQRSRLVLLASRHGPIELEPPTHSADSSGRQRTENILRELNARVVMYQELLDRAEASYKKFLEENEKVGRITRLLQAIDDS